MADHPDDLNDDINDKNSTGKLTPIDESAIDIYEYNSDDEIKDNYNNSKLVSSLPSN